MNFVNSEDSPVIEKFSKLKRTHAMLTTANITKDVTNHEHFSNEDESDEEEESEEPEIIPIQPKPFVCDLCDRGF